MHTPPTLSEPARELPVFGEFDVVVVGAGPAGLSAAVSAARHGAHTLLVERYGFAGGMGTAGGVTNFAGLYGRVDGDMVQVVHGTVDELLDRMDALGGLNQPQDGMQGRIRVRSYDVSAYKCAADQWLLAAGVRVLFHAQAAGALMIQDTARDAAGADSRRRISALVVETKSGRQAIRARVFVDASGDADLAHHAGVPYEVGDGAGSGLFPTTMFRIGGVDAPAALAAVGEFKAINDYMARAAGRYAFAREGAILRPQKDPTEWRANVTQIRNAQGTAMDATDARQLSAGEMDGRRQIVEYMRFLREQVPGFANARIVDIAPQVGIRESRRVQGLYQLGADDILYSACFEDSIGINAWPMELHNAGRVDWRFALDENRAFNELPYRMLVARGVTNLLVAGRCASMDHLGQSAARASGACFAMGQAAGSAAAMLTDGQTTSDVNVLQLQRRLREDGARIGLRTRASTPVTAGESR